MQVGHKMEKTTIIFFIGLMNGGGVEKIILSYCKNLDKNKFNFIFVTSKSSIQIPYDKIKNLNAKLVLTPDYYKDKLSYIKTVFKILKENKNSIFHCNYLSPLPYFIAKLVGIKNIIAHSHAYQAKVDFKHRIRRFLVCSFANTYFACAKNAGKYAFKNRKFTIINNAINLNDFAFDENFKKYFFEKNNLFDKKIIGHIGRFSKEKNHKFIIDMFKKVLEKDPSFYLLLVGDGELFDEIKNYSNDIGVYDNIIFLGNVDNANKIYSLFDIFVLPSLFEGFPITLVEAQANGLKCLVSDRVSKEINFINNCSFLTIENIDLWVNELLNSNFLRKKNSLKILEEKGFDIKTEAKKLEKIYESFK